MARIVVWYGGRSPAIERLTARLIHCVRRAYPYSTISFLANSANAYLAELQTEGVTIYRTEAPSGLTAPGKVLMQGPRHARLVLRVLSENRPDFVLITMNFALAWPLVFLCRLRKTPVAVFIHDPKPHLGDYAPIWQRLSQAWLIKQSAALVALSAWSADQLVGHGKPVMVWPINQFSPEVRPARRQRRKGSIIRFLFLGRMIAYKGLEDLLEACRHLQRVEGWTLTIAGDGPRGPWAQKAFSEIPQARLDHIRTLSEYEVDGMLLTHDVVVCPYREATQSAVVSEALYAGCPVIITEVAGLPEQIVAERSGIIVRASDAAALAAAMLRIIHEDGLLDRLSLGAAEQVDPARIDSAWTRNIETLVSQLRT